MPPYMCNFSSDVHGKRQEYSIYMCWKWSKLLSTDFFLHNDLNWYSLVLTTKTGSSFGSNVCDVNVYKGELLKKDEKVYIVIHVLVGWLYDTYGEVVPLLLKFFHFSFSIQKNYQFIYFIPTSDWISFFSSYQICLKHTCEILFINLYNSTITRDYVRSLFIRIPLRDQCWILQ